MAYLSFESTDLEPGPPRPAATLVEALTSAAAAFAVHPGDLLPALANAVSWAMYWQPPHAEDVVLTDPVVSATLLPIAEAVLATPQTRWWSAPLDRERQVRTVFEGASPPRPSSTAGERLDRWHDGVLAEERQLALDRARCPDRTIGSTWWVTPALAGLVTTTRARDGDGSAALWLTEDDAGWSSAEAAVRRRHRRARARDHRPSGLGPRSWRRTRSTSPCPRRPDWFGAVDAPAGGWAIPDWPAVAAVWDGVHVSVLGWLTTAGVAVPVGPGATTTLAGWDPDATWWLADVLVEQGARRRWVRDREASRPADGAQEG